ncbi:MAG TPA: hypothetical protein VHX17_06210 [Candidatus Cybelea sp.]|nr:hypothetical protein [Candidatus Cybelea sp.]
MWLIALLVGDIALAFIYVHERWFLTESWWKYYLLVSGLIASLSAVFAQRAIFYWFEPILMGAEYSPQEFRARTVNERLQRLLNLKWTFVAGTGLLLPIGIVFLWLLLPPPPFYPPSSPIYADPAAPYLYFVDRATSTVERYNVVQGLLSERIHIYGSPNDVVPIPHDAGSALVTASDGANADIGLFERVSFDHPEREAEILSVKPGPGTIVVTPDGSTAYVASVGEIPWGGVEIVDLRSFRVAGVIPNVNCAEGMALVRQRLLYVSTQCGFGDPVLVFDIRSPTEPKARFLDLEVGGRLVATPDGSKVYVARTNPPRSRLKANRLSVIDTRSQRVIATLAVDVSPDYMAMCPSGKFLLVGNNAAVRMVATDSDKLVNSKLDGTGGSARGFAILRRVDTQSTGFFGWWDGGGLFTRALAGYDC